MFAPSRNPQTQQDTPCDQVAAILAGSGQVSQSGRCVLMQQCITKVGTAAWQSFKKHFEQRLCAAQALPRRSAVPWSPSPPWLFCPMMSSLDSMRHEAKVSSLWDPVDGKSYVIGDPRGPGGSRYLRSYTVAAFYLLQVSLTSGLNCLTQVDTNPVVSKSRSKQSLQR